MFRLALSPPPSGLSLNCDKNSEFVGTGESYTAVFDIDHSVEGLSMAGGFVGFAGAIRSSSFNFSGGHTITDEFAGGLVRISPGSIDFLSNSVDFAPEDSVLSILFDSTLEEPALRVFNSEGGAARNFNS